MIVRRLCGELYVLIDVIVIREQLNSMFVLGKELPDVTVVRLKAIVDLYWDD